MGYIVIPPCEELKDFVSHFWAATWDEDIQKVASTYYVTANSLTEMVFAFKGTQQHSELQFASIQGQTSHPRQFPAGGFFELFGVALYSHAVPGLFHIPASELNDQFISPDTLLNAQGNQLTERVILASTTYARIKIVTDYFKARLAQERFDDRGIIQTVKQIRHHKGNINIVDLAQQLNLSQKQFQRRFKTYSGFNPKLYARVVRFEAILNSYAHYANLTEAAYANGYYDQAHFIHDFKSFAGYSPSQFFALSGY